MKYKVTLNGRTYEVEVEAGKAMLLDEYAAVAPAAAPVAAPAAAPAAPAAAPAPAAAGVNVTGGTTVSAPMPGNILKVNVTVGQTVKEGDLLVVLEAMKMENEIYAPCGGVVTALPVSKGATVDTGAALAVIGGTAAAAAPAPVAAPAAAPVPAAAAPVAAPAAAPVAGEAVTAPMPGNILKVAVTAGQSVKEGDLLVVLEAMKMENEIFAPKAGTVAQVLVSKGATVDTGATLVVLG